MWIIGFIPAFFWVILMVLMRRVRLRGAGVQARPMWLTCLSTALVVIMMIFSMLVLARGGVGNIYPITIVVLLTLLVAGEIGLYWKALHDDGERSEEA